MSWKMFFQIVLLIIITAVVMLGTKCALYKRGFKCHKKGIQIHQQDK